MEKKYNWKMIDKTSLVSKSLATPPYREPNCIQLSQSNKWSKIHREKKILSTLNLNTNQTQTTTLSSFM